jgi:hypothetical protein
MHADKMNCAGEIGETFYKRSLSVEASRQSGRNDVAKGGFNHGWTDEHGWENLLKVEIPNNPEGCWILAGRQAQRSPRIRQSQPLCPGRGAGNFGGRSFRRPIRGGKFTLLATGGRDGSTVLPPANFRDPSGIG